uniref:V-set immunoregulatory receptor n=1 Tax=Xiphophorus couchianus TaxID=32473 RepID=A0A3B5KWD9_9TELE
GDVFRTKVAPSHSSSPLTVSSAHRYYTCPEGVTAKLVCNQKNANLHPDHHVRDLWLFTPHTDLHCKKGETPRNVSHKPRNSNLGVEMNYTNENMWVILRNVTHADQGRYCCIALDVKIDHKQQTAQQSTHSHIILQVTPSKQTASVPVALALAACILALLSLPLILVLVYKQRENSRSNRRTEAQGHENPVFLIGSPQVKTRTVSQIMTRQPSETSRHLLSDPGTPLSPPAHGDVFFPSEGRNRRNLCLHIVTAVEKKKTSLFGDKRKCNRLLE